MKNFPISLLLLIVSFTASATKVQNDSLGLPGDGLNLYGVMELFKKSENPEEFEKALNKEDNKLNNLDLNGDGKTDYIRVIDRTEKEAHALVLQVAVNENESQDVAVIEIEKKGENNADVQIIGDEELYGKNYIIEPASENESKSAETATNKTNTTVVVNVWHWPAVRYIYRPSYVVWASPWGWGHYPGWWTPWRPVYWHHYHPHWHPYHSYHRRVHTHRVVVAHNVYYGHRKVSKTVYQKRTTAPVRHAGQPVRKPPKTYKEQGPRKQQVTPKQQKSRQNKQGAQKNNGRRK